MFEGKVAVITGAAGGIGLATAWRFAELGATVVISDVNREAGEREADNLRTQGHAAEFAYADVSDYDSVASLFRQVRDSHGRLDYAFNNAGIEGHMGPAEEADLSNWERVIGINLSGVYYCIREEIPLMKESGGGVIVNCSSIAGLVGSRGGYAYCASKHGVIGMTKAIALDLARDNIRVNAVCPGAVDTPMIQRVFDKDPEMRAVIENMQPIGRMATPEEIAGAVVWLCQPDSAAVTGIALPIDGAWTAH